MPGDARGSWQNELLTATVATLLLVLIAVEGATLLDMRRFLSVHAFVGVLLVPVVAWRRPPGGGPRFGLVAGSLAAGLVLAVTVLPAVDHLQDSITGPARIDGD